MARARAVETRLERQLPVIDEFFTSGFLTKEELLELTRTRTHWEYRLVAKPLLLLDVQNAVKYELAVEERLRQYCQRTKVNLKHRWSVLERIEYIYNIGVKHLKNKADKETVRKEFVLFLKSFSRISSLSKLYGQLMISFPTRGDIWVEAALWEGLERRNMDHARAILQQALVTMSSDPAVWAAALRLELAFAGRLMEGVLEEHAAQQRKNRKQQQQQQGQAGSKEGVDSIDRPLSATLRSENDAMAELILGLALAKAVVEEAVESPASGPELLKQMLAVCGEYGFAKEVAVAAVDLTVRKMYDVLSRHQSVVSAPAAGTDGERRKRSSNGSRAEPSQRERSRWREGGLTFILQRYLLVEQLCVSEGRTPLRTAAAFLDEEAGAVGAGGGDDAAARTAQRASAATPAARRHAATAALASLLLFAALPREVRAEVCAGCAPEGVWRDVVLDGVGRVMQVLAATSPAPESVSRACLSLMLLPRNGLDAAAARSILEAVAAVEQSASAEAAGRRGAAAGSHVETAFIEPAQARLRELLEQAREGSMGGAAKAAAAKKPRVDAADQDSGADGRWPASMLGRFLTVEDRKALAVAHAQPGRTTGRSSVAATTVTSDDVDELLLWWRTEEKTVAGARGGRAEDEAAAAAVRARLRRAALAFFRRFGLVASSSADAEAAAQTSSAAHGAKNEKRARQRSATATIAPPSASEGEEAAFGREHPLLLLSNGIRFSDPASTPLCLWRVFNALEVTEGSHLQDALPSGSTLSSSPSAPASHEESDSDSEEEGSEGPRTARSPRLPPHFDSYAAAGAHFLASAQHGLLDRQGQLDRAVALAALARSRLFSLTGVKAASTPATTRADLVGWLAAHDTAGHQLRKGGKWEVEEGRATVATRLASMNAFLEMLERRCQPLPRQCQVAVTIPFLEAVAQHLKQGQSGSSAHTAPGTAAGVAVKKARAAHERLIDLYGFTKHLSDFMPVLYHHRGGSSATPAAAAPSFLSLQPKHTDFKASEHRVAEFNVEDWIAYVLFERSIAQDLNRAKDVAERARRACLAPQQLLVKLSNAGA